MAAKGHPKSGGRKAGAKNVATREAKLALEALAQQHSEAALGALVDVMNNSVSPAARVAAAVAILDRGYGKPRQALEHSGGLSLAELVQGSYRPHP
jgi:hypothetical protein